jgi:DNA-binding transcriptional ArsR family regulator
MLEGVGMLETAGKTLTEDQVLLIAKALGDRRRYEILKRLGERPDALACGVVRDCMGINPATLSHHMKERPLLAIATRGFVTLAGFTCFYSLPGESPAKRFQ